MRHGERIDEVSYADVHAVTSLGSPFVTSSTKQLYILACQMQDLQCYRLGLAL